MATYDHVAFLEAASDPTTADLLDTAGTDTRAAAARLIAQVAASEIAQASPEIAQAAADLIATAAGIMIAQSTPQIDDTAVSFTDENGNRLPAAQYTAQGYPANAMMQAFVTRGMIRVSEGVGGAVVFTDTYGNRTWISIAPDGGMDFASKTYLLNTLGIAWGPEPPYVYPGTSVHWVNTTDMTLHRLEN